MENFEILTDACDDCPFSKFCSYAHEDTDCELEARWKDVPSMIKVTKELEQMLKRVNELDYEFSYTIPYDVTDGLQEAVKHFKYKVKRLTQEYENFKITLDKSKR